MAIDKNNYCIDCSKGPLCWGSKRCRICSSKRTSIKLWGNKDYRKKMSESHKGKVPKNIQQLIDSAKSPEGRKRTSLINKGRSPWNKGIKIPAITGENHYKWTGGKYSESYRQRRTFRDSIQKLVLERDCYKCTKCNQGGDLQVDHIQPWAEYAELRFDMNNCRTLCTRCHYELTFNRPMPINIKGWGHNLLERVGIAK